MNIWLSQNEQYQRLYNCTSYNVDAVPLEQRQHIYVGYGLVVLAVLFEVCLSLT